MALFGKQDQDAPLLTSFYQLEFDPKGDLVHSELDMWLGLAFLFYDAGVTAKECIIIEPIPFSVGLPAVMTKYWQDSGEIQPLRDKEMLDKSIIETFDIFATLHPHIKILMDAKRQCDTPFLEANPFEIGVIGKAIEIVNSFIRREKKSVSIYANHVLFVTPDGIIGKEKFPRLGVVGETFQDSLLDQILLNLINAIENSAFKFCSECDSVFPQTGQSQTYCSRRCANRVTSRRYYKKKTK
jgi:hypothetical protein